MTLNLIAVGYSLGLAASVLYLGAIGDRYGRKLMLVLGTALAIPMSLLAAFAPSDEVLFVARVGGGLAAGMAYPTTLALITALWSGPARTKSIALWSALGGAIAALGPLVSGALLEQFCWGSVFLVTLPLAAVALVLAFLLRAEPRQRDDGARGQPRRHPVRACSSARSSSGSTSRRSRTRARSSLGLAAIALAALVGFYLRQRRAANPLYDLDVAGRRVFWVAACAGIIVFGSLMGAAFISQQYLQNVLGYSTLEAGRRDPAGGAVHGARRAALGQARRGARRPVHAALRLRLPACSAFLDDAPALDGGHRRTGRSRSRTRSSASASASRGRRHRTRSPARCR